MSEWREYQLEDIAQINPTERLPKGTVAKKVAMEILQPFTKKIPTFTLEEYKGGIKFRNGDTVMARITPSLENGKTAYVDILDDAEVGYGSTEFIVLREKEGISDKHFLYYFAISPELRDIAILSMTGSSGRQRVQTDVVKQHEFLLPPLPEQKAIAEVLSSLDDKIDLLHRQNKTLEQMAETLFRQWFVEEAGEDWGEVTFDDVLTISSSKRIFYKEYVDFGVPFYRSKEIIELSKGGATSTELFISEERFNEIDSKFGSPKEGDILLTSVGTLGVSYQVKKADKFYFKDGNLTWFKDFRLLPSSIVYCWLNSSIGKEELDNISIGSTQAALTISGLKSIDLKIPSPEIIKKVDDDLNTIYEKFFFNQTQIHTLQSLRDTLLPKLMSGEVRIASNG